MREGGWRKRWVGERGRAEREKVEIASGMGGKERIGRERGRVGIEREKEGREKEGREKGEKGKVGKGKLWRGRGMEEEKGIVIIRRGIEIERKKKRREKRERGRRTREREEKEKKK